MMDKQFKPLVEESDICDSPRGKIESQSKIPTKLSKSVIDAYLPYKGDFSKYYI